MCDCVIVVFVRHFCCYFIQYSEATFEAVPINLFLLIRFVVVVLSCVAHIRPDSMV